MYFPVPAIVRFHLQKWMREHKIPVMLFAVASSLAVVAACWVFSQWQTLNSANSRLGEAFIESKRSRTADAGVKVRASAAPLDLPPFDSAQMVAQLNEAAKDAGLSLDKVAYVLEENSSQPYLRYRITMSSTMRYPVVRSFIEQMDGSIPHLSFDAIACARKGISIVELSCDLMMSGFYRKRSSG